MVDDEYEWGQQDRLRCLRNYLGLSVDEIAAALDTSTRSYRNFESGRTAIPQGVLDDVAILIDRLHTLADSYVEQGTVDIGDVSAFELRAAGMAVAENPNLTVSNASHR